MYGLFKITSLQPQLFTPHDEFESIIIINAAQQQIYTVNKLYTNFLETVKLPLRFCAIW